MLDKEGYGYLGVNGLQDPFIVRPAGPGDGEAIRRVYREAGRAGWSHFLPVEEDFSHGPSSEDWERLIAGFDDATVLIAQRRDGVVGFASVRPSQDSDADEGVGELDTLYVLPTVWGQGAGRKLIDAGLRSLSERGFTEATLWTAEQNSRSRQLYEHAGWRPDGKRRPKTYLGTQFEELRYRVELRGR